MMKISNRKIVFLLVALIIGVVFGALTVTAADASEIIDDADYDVQAEIDAEFAEFNSSPEDYNYFDRYLQTTTTTESTRCNFWCMLKESIGLTIIGLLLIICVPCAMWKNEGRHVRELRRIDFCKNKAIVVENADIPSNENIGQLVHFTGQVTAGDTELKPTGLNIIEPMPNALIVKRTCLIYQKFEDAQGNVDKDRFGGGQTRTTTFTLREDWTPMGPQPTLEHLNDTNSSGIWADLVVAAGGDPNSEADQSPVAPTPPNMPPQMAALLQRVDPSKVPHDIAVSPAAHVGGFGLSEQIVLAEPTVFQTDWEPLPANLVPDVVEGCENLIKGSDGILTTVPEGEQPRNGDVMVKYEYIPDDFKCSFIVEQVVADESIDPEVGCKYSVAKADVIDDKCFGVIHDNLGLIWMVRRGQHDLPDMINMAKTDEKNITKLLRIICYVLLIVGWIMLFSIFTTVLNTLPILGSLGYFAVVVIALVVGTVCCCGVTALAYIAYRPLIALGMLTLGLGIWGIVAWRLNEAAENSAEPTPSPTGK